MARTADTAMYEAMALHQQKSDEIVAANTKAIAELTAAIREQAKSISSQGDALNRLERAVSELVVGINAQKETMADFLKLAQMQAETIGALAKRAS